MKTARIAVTGCCMAIIFCIGSGETVAGIDAGGDPKPPTTTRMIGRVSDSGGVVVNDVHFDTSNTVFTGKAVSESDLSPGQIVVISGSLDSDGTTGTADTLDSVDALTGPILEIDRATGTLNAMGQTVIVTPGTSFGQHIGENALNSLSINDRVKITGYYDANDYLVATQIALEAGGNTVELLGVARNVDTNMHSFEINGLIVDYGAAMIHDFPYGQPEEAQRIKVVGTEIRSSSELVATSIELRENDFRILDVGDHAEIEGIVTRFASADDFDVNGVVIAAESETSFKNGSQLELSANRRIRLSGTVTSDGKILAKYIEFSD